MGVVVGGDVWHLARDGKQHGPYQFQTLVEGVSKGAVVESDLIWRPGWDSWRLAHSVSGLFAPPELAASPKLPTAQLESAALPITKADIATALDRAGVPRNGQGRNYLVRHWRGELSLPVSYWVNGILATAVAYALGSILQHFVDNGGLGVGTPMVAALISVISIILVVSAWQMVGVWRSATRYAARGKRFWGGVAKFVVIIGVTRTVLDFGNVVLPVVSEHIEIAMGDQRMGGNHFRLLRNASELEFSGGINFGTAKEFERMLDAASQVRVLHLNSRGGRIAEADLMAAEVRKRRLITYVSEQCHSACTHVFMAGQERWISERGILGFHQPSFPGVDREERAKLIGQEHRYLISLGLPKEFVSKAIETPSNDMWKPSHKELLAARAISGVADGSRFAASGQTASMPTAELEKTILKIPLYAALKRTEPEAFEEVLAQFASGYRRGASEEEIASSARTVLSKTVMRKLPHATDTDILQSVDIRIGYMDGLRGADPESCVAIEDATKGARLKSDLAKTFPAIASKEIALMQILVESNGKRPIPSDEQVEPYLEKVRGNVAKRRGVNIGIIDKAKLAPSEYGLFCDAVLAFYQEARRLPAKESVSVFRNLFADAGK